MPNLDAKHFLGIYQTRKEMQEKGITNPPPKIKALTNQIVEKLSKFPSSEKIDILHGNLVDSKGNIIATLPKRKK